MSFVDTILKLTRQLYPTGRAFAIPKDGVLDKVHTALAQTESQYHEDALATFDVILPDNANFTEEDADRWEEFLGIITNSSVTLEDRKLAIKRKYNHPGTILARQSADYLQDQLQAAGFDVYVYENRFTDGMGGYEVKAPVNVFGALVTGIAVHGSDAEHGPLVHGNAYTGSVWEDMIVNHIDEDLDAWFDVGTSLRDTFYLSSAYIETPAQIDANRKDEFRQLVLSKKPTHTKAFLYAEFI